MLCTGDSFPVPTYKDYLFKKFIKHKEKLVNQCQQIRQCSLKASDKKKLINEMMDMLREEQRKPDYNS